MNLKNLIAAALMGICLSACGETGGGLSPGGESGTRTGSPLVTLNVNFVSSLPSKLSSVSVCLNGILLVNQGSSFTQAVTFKERLITIDANGSLPVLEQELANIQIGTYDRISFILSDDCGIAAQVVNGSGEFKLESVSGRFHLSFDLKTTPIVVRSGAPLTSNIDTTEFLISASKVKNEPELEQTMSGTYQGN